MNQAIVTGVVERVEAKALNEGDTLLTFNLVGAYEEGGKERNFVVPVSLFGKPARRATSTRYPMPRRASSGRPTCLSPRSTTLCSRGGWWMPPVRQSAAPCA